MKWLDRHELVPASEIVSVDVVGTYLRREADELDYVANYFQNLTYKYRHSAQALRDRSSTFEGLELLTRRLNDLVISNDEVENAWVSSKRSIAAIELVRQEFVLEKFGVRGLLPSLIFAFNARGDIPATNARTDEIGVYTYGINGKLVPHAGITYVTAPYTCWGSYFNPQTGTRGYYDWVPSVRDAILHGQWHVLVDRLRALEHTTIKNVSPDNINYHLAMVNAPAIEWTPLEPAKEPAKEAVPKVKLHVDGVF